MEKIKKFVNVAIPLIAVGVLAALVFEIKLVLILFFSALLFSAYVIYKDKIGQELVIAFLIAFAWTSYYVYSYTSDNLMMGDVNLFPLVSWTFGLVVLREIYERLKGRNRFLKITLIYLAGLFIVEFIGYYLLGIRLVGNYPSLLGIGIIHAPFLMKIFYLISGPVYILITDYLHVK